MISMLPVQSFSRPSTAIPLPDLEARGFGSAQANRSSRNGKNWLDCGVDRVKPPFEQGDGHLEVVATGP
jgi:hypothetical protein